MNSRRFSRHHNTYQNFLVSSLREVRAYLARPKISAASKEDAEFWARFYAARIIANHQG